MNEELQTSIDREPGTRIRVVYVTPDCTDSAVQKRARGFLNQRADLVSFSFRRSRYNQDFEPDWTNVELGRTTERRLFSRVFAFIRALRIIYAHRDIWRRASLVYARNLDLGLLALLGKLVTRCRAPLVYEVLDIHPAMMKPGLRGKFARWLERRVLARCRLLVVSSPAYLRHYFQPVQRYKGESFLLENKWPHEQMRSLPRKLNYQVDKSGTTWTIGWFGNIRCHQSLKVLTALADGLPEKVSIYIRGHASLLGEQKLREATQNRDNMVFEGEYQAPDELPSIYSNVHFNWCVDFDDGVNSLWLLPNRLYEGGYFGVPALAIASHETGRVVRERELGIPIEAPVDDFLKALFLKLDPDEYMRMRHRIESLPNSNFVDDGEIGRLIQTTLGCEEPSPAKTTC